MQPRQSKGVQPGLAADAASVHGIAAAIEDWRIDPFEIRAKAYAPDDGGNTLFTQV
jgi:hypothetical protein